jgi:hypothetical protein
MRWRWLLAAGALAVICVVVAVVVFGPPPAWLSLLLGTIALAVLYTVARMNSRYDPLDPRFGSCIPPLPRSPRGDA